MLDLACQKEALTRLALSFLALEVRGLTRILIKAHYDYPRRCELVRLMWELALADGEHHHLEEHRIRQLADLLHVSHGDFIRAKLQAQEAAT